MKSSRHAPRWRAVVAHILGCVALVIAPFAGVAASPDLLSKAGLDEALRPQPFVCGTESPANHRSLKAAAAGLSSAIGEKKILLYRVDFSDSPGAAISSNVAASLLIDLNSYYRDMSYGR